MTFAKAILSAAIAVSAASIVPAAAQPVPSATATPPAAPPTWTVVTDEVRGAVQIAAAAKGGTAILVAGCRKGAEPGLTGAFSRYSGTGLRTDGQIEHVAFYARGADWQDAFSVRLRYSAASQSWEFARPLSSVFLSSFSRGATLAVVNSRNQEIFAFDLTGSTAATRAMRTICGLE